MNLLPKSSSQFADSSFWENFFRKRKKSFEWYGTYTDLCGLLHRYIRPNNSLLVPGCGNSTLSYDLHKVGVEHIVNIDISKTVISQMKKKYEATTLEYHCMDVCNITFDDESFDVVLDKGTLDALLHDESDESFQMVDRMFSECGRVLKYLGRFIIVSLAQAHVVSFLYAWFTKRNWIMRIHKLNIEGDFPLPLFIFVCTKMKPLPGFQSTVDFASEGNGKSRRIPSAECMLDEINANQELAVFIKNLKCTLASYGETSLELADPERPDSPRYRIFVVECTGMNKYLKPYAAFVVPKGRDTEWLFCSTEGRRRLLESCQCKRMSVILLSRSHSYDSLEAINAELSTRILDFAPTLPVAYQVPYLSLGAEVGRRVERERYASKHSGDFVVEDVFMEDTQSWMRRLVFLASVSVIQSEVGLKSLVNSQKGSEMSAPCQIDLLTLTCHYHIALVACLAYLPSRRLDVDVSCHLLLLGLGGGVFSSFLGRIFPSILQTAVEIDPAIVEAAKAWFGLDEIMVERQQGTPSLYLEVNDGLIYLENCTSGKFDVIVLDIDSKDQSLGVSCPAPAFLTDSCLSNLSRSLKEDGIFLLNLVARNEERKVDAKQLIRKHFEIIVSIQLEHDLNEIVVMRRKSNSNNPANLSNMCESLSGKVKSLSLDMKKSKNDFISHLPCGKTVLQKIQSTPQQKEFERFIHFLGAQFPNVTLSFDFFA